MSFLCIACAKDAVVAANYEVLGGSNKWNVVFLERLMIGRWRSLPLSSRCCTPPE
jgi:hypothetical protein